MGNQRLVGLGRPRGLAWVRQEAAAVPSVLSPGPHVLEKYRSRTIANYVECNLHGDQVFQV